MTDQDHEHLLACWPRTWLNGPTHKVAEWCGWTFDEALVKLLALQEAGLIISTSRDQVPCYPSGPNAGKPLHFWVRPDGAHGLPFVEDPRLLACGIIRALRDDESKVVTYQGEPELHVRRVAKREGWSHGGYRLNWLGPDPTGKKHLDLPVGVVLEAPVNTQ